MTYYFGLGFIVTGAFLAARSFVGLKSHTIDEYSNTAGLYLVQGMFAASMALFGFFLRHRDVFEPMLRSDADLTPAPTPASAEDLPRKKRPGRNPGRG